MKETTLPTIEDVKGKVRPILRRYGVRRAAVFGSLARGRPRRRSDVDLLVEFEKPIGLFDFVGLKQDLEDALGRKVDVVEYQALKPRLRERVLAEHVPIL